jgi:MFS family permease
MFETPLGVGTAALTSFLLFSSLGILAGGVLADRIGPRVSTAVATLVSAGALVLAIGAVPMGATLLILVSGASGFLQGLLMPTRDLLIREVTPDGSMGKVIGFLSTGMMAASGVVPALFGWLIDRGAADYVFWLSAVFVIGSLLSFVSVRGRAPPRPGIRPGGGPGA